MLPPKNTQNADAQASVVCVNSINTKLWIQTSIRYPMYLSRHKFDQAHPPPVGACLYSLH